MVRLSLMYPNGRRHSVDWVDDSQPMKPGAEFELYGRRWRVIGPEARRGREAPPARLICQPITAGILHAPE